MFLSNNHIIQDIFCIYLLFFILYLLIIIAAGIENKHFNLSPSNKNPFGGKHCTVWTKQHISALSLWLTIKWNPILVVSCFPTIPHTPTPIYTHTCVTPYPFRPPRHPTATIHRHLTDCLFQPKSDDWSVAGHVGLWTRLTRWGRSDVWEMWQLFWFVWNVCRRQTQQKFPQQPCHPASSQSTR